MTKKYKHNNNKTQNQTLNIFARAGNRTRNNSRPSWMRYLWTTESTESTDCCQAIELFPCNGLKPKFHCLNVVEIYDVNNSDKKIQIQT